MNACSNSLNDQTVYVVNIGKPCLRLLVWLDIVCSVLHELVDLLSMISDVF